MNGRIWPWLALIGGAVIVAANTFFTVDQRQQAVVLHLGRPTSVINPAGDYDPGLKARIPFVESVVRFDRRNMALEPPPEEVITGDYQRLIVGAYVRYRVSDPLVFYRALGGEKATAQALGPLVNSSLQQVLASAPATDVISLRREALMVQTLAIVRARVARSRFGIDVIDVRLSRSSLPPAAQEPVFNRMRADLQQQAAQIREQGEATKREIMADADRQVTVTRATANQQAYTIQGAGDAESARLFASSFGKDPGFAAFYRSMQAYRYSFADGQTTMILSPDSEFLKYFRKGPNAR